jgi:DNA-binding transcriptional regulator GbsR (MarR family)
MKKINKKNIKNNLSKEFIDIFKQISIYQGFDNLMAEIFALVYISTEDLSLEKISEISGYSLASISNKVKFMESLGLIMRFTKPGSRKIYLKTEKNIIKLSKENLINQKAKSLVLAKELIPKLIEKYKYLKLNEKDKIKFKIIEDYYNQILLSEKIIDKLIEDFDKLLREMK